MTEGVLGKKPYSAPQKSIKRTRAAGVLARRYTAACRRAGRKTRLRAFAGRFSFLSAVASSSSLPVRYTLGSMFFFLAQLWITLGEAAGKARFHSGQFLLQAVRALKKGLEIRRHLRFNTAVVFVSAVAVSVAMSFYGVGLEVVLDGKSIGYVSNQDEFLEAVDHVSERAGEILSKPYVMNPDVRYRFSVVRRSEIFNGPQVEEQLFAQIPELKRMYVLSVNGAIVGGSTVRGDIQGILDGILSQYKLESSADSVGFVQDVEITFQTTAASWERTPAQLGELLTGTVREAVYYDVAEDDTLGSISLKNAISVDKLEELNPAVETLGEGQRLLLSRPEPFLSVYYNKRVTYSEPIQYETEIVYDDKKFEGYSEVSVRGVNGEALVNADVRHLDGREVGSEISSRYIVSAPVNEVIVKGTKKQVTVGTFIRPYHGALTSGYGNRFFMGKNEFHPGLDLAGPSGSPIVASDGGVVVFSGYQNAYGNLVIIDHGKGFKTVYAHCSKLLVSEGQKVGQGELIAKVGSTGRSTGPHVHFEIRINDQHVNPNKYLID